MKDKIYDVYNIIEYINLLYKSVGIYYIIRNCLK